MGQCLGKFHKGATLNIVKDPFPDHYTDSQICDYFVDHLPRRLVGEGIHLLRGRPGPIMQGWTHELLNEAGVHSYQDRELLLKTRDDIVSAVARQRLRQRPPSRSANNCTDHRSHHAASPSATEPVTSLTNPPGFASVPAAEPNIPMSHQPTAIDLSPPDAMDVAEVVGPGAVPAASVHRAAARLQAAAAAAAAAATAAAATAKSTAFCSEGDGKPFRLTTDWLPSCQQLYRISEEIRHMASSGNLDSSVHAKSVSGVLDVPAAAVAAAAAGVGSSNVPLHTRFKSRFHPAAAAAAGRGDSGGSGGGDGAEGDGERDDEGGMHDRDADGKVAAAAAAATMMPLAVSCATAAAAAAGRCGVTCPQHDYDTPPSGVLGLPPGATDQAAAAMLTPQRQHFENNDDDGGGGGSGGGNSCCCGGSGSGEESGGSADSRSFESPLGADSLAALTALEAPPPPSPEEPLLQPDVATSDTAGSCAVPGRPEPKHLVQQVPLCFGSASG